MTLVVPTVDTVCEHCGVVYLSPLHYTGPKYCSDMCRASRRHGDKIKRPQAIARPNYYSKKRRAAMWRGDKIDRIAVFEFHNWVCCVCKREIDKSLRLPDPGAATLEHVVPLSKGGTHSWENVAPSHHRCNSDKGCS